MNGDSTVDPDDHEFVEVDPTGRYGRYNEILGKGSSKTVYRAFDEYEGIEVAWNQVKLYDFLQRPEDLERLYCEIHLLKTLKHKSIIKFYGSWIDSTNRNLNFVTEMFTSGTLREYRMKHKRVNIIAIKDWCRQILEGLYYLHSLDPPVIHRDLKCDNIFINGHQGQVKIGDLGLAAILRKSHADRCVGTPEFMAPEVYAEEYNELVDIYAFGMCILEMVTFEYPYSECTHPAQIYKKVVSGKKPEALYKVRDPEVRRFVEKCLATVSCRLTAEELLKDPFLQIDYFASNPHLRMPQNYLDNEFEGNEIDIFTSEDEDGFADAEIAINGRRSEDDDIFLRLRIADKEGRVRNIYFSFDTETDTAMSVAAEMVAELDMTDQDYTKIADMIDGQIASLVPEWKSGLSVEEKIKSSDPNTSENYHSCASGDSAVDDYLCGECTGSTNLQVLHCSQQGCAAVHGRFEEITYQFEEDAEIVVSSMSHHGLQCEISLEESEEGHYDDEKHDCEKNVDVDTDKKKKSRPPLGRHFSFHQSATPLGGHYDDEKHEKVDVDAEKKKKKSRPPLGRHLSFHHQSATRVFTGYGNEVRRELRWLKAKYQMQLRGSFRGEKYGTSANLHPSSSSPGLDKTPFKNEALVSCATGKHFRSYTDVGALEKFADQTSVFCDAGYEEGGSCSPEQFLMEKRSFYTEELIPHSINRAISLPVDAVDF